MQEFDTVLVWAYATIVPNQIRRKVTALANGSHALKQRSYAAVVTWNGYLLPFADQLARELGVPTRYLGSRSLNELDKISIREILREGQTAGAVPRSHALAGAPLCSRFCHYLYHCTHRLRCYCRSLCRVDALPSRPHV